MKPILSTEQLAAICDLPSDFHAAGVMASPVLAMMARLLAPMEIQCSAETGAGKTTLLFSQLSQRHLVFALDRFDNFDTGSMQAVKASKLLRQERVVFIIGPTQKTLPIYRFEHALDVILIDGPHGYPFPELEYYYFYPHLRVGGLLFLDDIHIPSLWRLFEFLLEDEMFELVEVCAFTAVFRRTQAALFDPYGDGWWLQGFNQKYQNEAAAWTRGRLDQILAERRLPSHEALLQRQGMKAWLYRCSIQFLGGKLSRRLRNAWHAFQQS